LYWHFCTCSPIWNHKELISKKLFFLLELIYRISHINPTICSTFELGLDFRISFYLSKVIKQYLQSNKMQLIIFFIMMFFYCWPNSKGLFIKPMLNLSKIKIFCLIFFVNNTIFYKKQTWKNLYTKHTKQKLPISFLDEGWEFLSNLKKFKKLITPEYMGFEIISAQIDQCVSSNTTNIVTPVLGN
jgi:hypothetical protein